MNKNRFLVQVGFLIAIYGALPFNKIKRVGLKG